LPLQQLSRKGSSSCIVISCATVITILSIGGSREIYRHSDASGPRAAYGSYFGFWYIKWPLGQAATVSLEFHVSHSLSRDVYPRKFVRRVDRCIRMTSGVITSPSAKSFQCGFSVRKPPGEWILQYQRKFSPGRMEGDICTIGKGKGLRGRFSLCWESRDGSSDQLLAIVSSEPGEKRAGYIACARERTVNPGSCP